MHRAIYFANHFGVDVGMFYKRRDYSRIVNGKNPIVSHDFLGTDVEGKDVIIIDDMIASGESMLDVARKLKSLHANRVFCLSTFGLFTAGLDVFDKAYEEGIIEKVITTNVTYQKPELKEREWYESADMSKYIAIIIDHLNHDASLSDLLDPRERIQARLNEYRQFHTISDNYSAPLSKHTKNVRRQAHQKNADRNSPTGVFLSHFHLTKEFLCSFIAGIIDHILRASFLYDDTFIDEDHPVSHLSCK